MKKRILLGLAILLACSLTYSCNKSTAEKSYLMEITFDNSIYEDSLEFLKIKDFTDSCFNGTTRKISNYVYFINNSEEIESFTISREKYFTSYNPKTIYAQVEQYDQNKVLWKIIYHNWLRDGNNFTTEYLVKTIKSLADSSIDESVYFQCLDYCLYYYCLYNSIGAENSLDSVLPS